jgi:hypothetical protein
MFYSFGRSMIGSSRFGWIRVIIIITDGCSWTRLKTPVPGKYWPMALCKSGWIETARESTVR